MKKRINIKRMVILSRMKELLIQDMKKHARSFSDIQKTNFVDLKRSVISLNSLLLVADYLGKEFEISLKEKS